MSRGSEPVAPCSTTEWGEFPGGRQSFQQHHAGMTIREAFAMAAMQGLLANPAESQGTASTLLPSEVLPAVATAATRMADALLAALNKEPTA